MNTKKVISFLLMLLTVCSTYTFGFFWGQSNDPVILTVGIFGYGLLGIFWDYDLLNK